MRSSETSPTPPAPPCSKARTPSATVNAHSAVHAAPKASCALRRSALDQVAAKAPPAARRRTRTLRPVTAATYAATTSPGGLLTAAATGAPREVVEPRTAKGPPGSLRAGPLRSYDRPARAAGDRLVLGRRRLDRRGIGQGCLLLAGEGERGLLALTLDAHQHD